MARILVIDDEPSLRRFMRRILEDAGHDVESTPSAEWAITELAKDACRFDACVVDYMLPGANGETFHRHLTKLCPGLPMMITSGSSIDPQLPGVPFLAKPFEPFELVAAVNRMLDPPDDPKAA